MNKKHVIFLSVAALTLYQSAHAMELWDPRCRTLGVGEYAGMLPPKGIYFSDDNTFIQYNEFNSNGKKMSDTKANAYINTPALLWSTGLKFLGGSYAVGIAQPLDYTSASSGYGVKPGPGNIGFYNTVLVPGLISWNFEPLFVSAGLSLYLPDGTNTMVDFLHGKMNNGGLPSANGYLSIEPDLGLTMMLPEGWSASAAFYLNFPLESTKTTLDGGTYHYHSGNILMGDYTIGKTVGAWMLGVGGATQDQLNHDTNTGTIKPFTHGDARNYSISAFATYHFKGGVSLTGIISHGLSTANDLGGNIFDLRIAAPI